jgi:predicted PurR-regulated permease PerM
VLLGLLVQQIWSALLPLSLALLIASVLQVPARFLEERLHFPKAAAAGAVVVGSVLVVVALGFALAPAVAGQSTDIIDSAVGGLQELQNWVQDTNFLTRDQVDAAIQALQDRLASSGGQIADGVLTGVSAATSAVVTLVVTLILTFLFLKDGHRFQPLVRRMTGPRVGPHLVEVLKRIWKTLGGYIRTQALVSLIDAVLIGAGLLLVGVPLAIPLAVLTFVGGFIPIVGAFVAGVLAVLVALVSEGLTGALIILAVVVAVQQLEGNVLSPWLQSKSMQLHAGVVLLGVTLGSTLFGIIGAFLAVPVCAVAAVIIRYLDELVEVVTIPALAPAAPQPSAGPDPDDEEDAMGTGS